MRSGKQLKTESKILFSLSGFIMFLCCLLFFVDDMFIFNILLIPIAICSLIGGIYDNNKAKKDETENDTINEIFRKSKVEINEWKNFVYPKLIKEHGVPDNAQITAAEVSRGFTKGLTRKTNYVYVHNDCLCLFPTYDNFVELRFLNFVGAELIFKLEEYFHLTKIPINSIEFFKITGDFYHETKISGGGGGGSSVSGAVLGGLIAGATGAIVGSRTKIEEIKSDTITHDTREIELNYFVNNDRKTMIFDYDDLQILNDLMPEKNYEIVSELKKQKFVQSEIGMGKNQAIIEQIKELALLKDNGIITEEEFCSKKKELLSRI